MSIEKCILGRVAAGAITQKQADAAIEQIRQRRDDLGIEAGSPR